jgi:Spy/CpxP family protein refolding chaperone
MVSFRRLASVTSLLSTLALGSSAVAFAAPEAAPSADVGARHGNAHHGRRGDLLRASLHLDSLSTSQRQQIEALVAQEKAAHGNVAAARSQLLEALAGSVAAGSVDDVALAPDIQRVEGAIQADEPADRAALEKLHAILTPAQRIELVTRIESHTHGRGPGAGAGADGGGAGAKMGAGMGHGEHLWGHALNLSDAQKQQIEVNLRSIGPSVDRSVWKQERETHENVLTAFKGDSFVMNRVAPPRDPRLIDAEAERIVRMAKASAPVLTPEQRATAAAKLRDFAAKAGAQK